jgi:hypothetical protein
VTLSSATLGEHVHNQMNIAFIHFNYHLPLYI